MGEARSSASNFRVSRRPACGPPRSLRGRRCFAEPAPHESNVRRRGGRFTSRCGERAAVGTGRRGGRFPGCCGERASESMTASRSNRRAAWSASARTVVHHQTIMVVRAPSGRAAAGSHTARTRKRHLHLAREHLRACASRAVGRERSIPRLRARRHPGRPGDRCCGFWACPVPSLSANALRKRA